MNKTKVVEATKTTSVGALVIIIFIMFLTLGFVQEIILALILIVLFLATSYMIGYAILEAHKEFNKKN